MHYLTLLDLAVIMQVSLLRDMLSAKQKQAERHLIMRGENLCH